MTPEELRKKTEAALAEQQRQARAKAAQADVMEDAYRRRADVIIGLVLFSAEHVAGVGGSRVHVMDVYTEDSEKGMEKEGFNIPSNVPQAQRMAMVHPGLWLTRVAKYVYRDLVGQGYTVTFEYRGSNYREYFKMFIEW